MRECCHFRALEMVLNQTLYLDDIGFLSRVVTLKVLSILLFTI
jgi:hypothetical protein